MLQFFAKTEKWNKNDEFIIFTLKILHFFQPNEKNNIIQWTKVNEINERFAVAATWLCSSGVCMLSASVLCCLFLLHLLPIERVANLMRAQAILSDLSVGQTCNTCTRFDHSEIQYVYSFYTLFSFPILLVSTAQVNEMPKNERTIAFFSVAKEKKRKKQFFCNNFKYFLLSTGFSIHKIPRRRYTIFFRM